MSRSRTSLTPFDIEPHSHLLTELQRGFDECTERKRKDAHEVWKLAQELVDGYDGVDDRSAERKSEILELISTIFDNTEKYRQLRRQQLQTSEILQSLASGIFGAPTPQAAQPETGNHNISVQQPEVAANSQDIPATEDSYPRQPPDAVETGSAVENGEASQTQDLIYKDLMPPLGIRSVPEADRKSLGVRLRRQLQTINEIRPQTINARQYRQFFNRRPIFHYKRCLYIARCSVHPDLKMTLEQAKKHYQLKHLVEYQGRLHVETMKFFGVKIIDTFEELQRVADRATNEALLGSEPTGVATGPGISPGAEYVPDRGAEQLTNGNSNAMQVYEAAANPEHQCQGAEIEVASSTMKSNPREISPLSDVEEEAEDVSMDVTSNADTWSWALSSATNSREATPKQPENDDNDRTSGDPVMVCHSRDGNSNESAGADPQTPHRHIVTLRLTGSPNTVRRKLGVRGVKISSQLTCPWNLARPRTSASASTAAGASAGVTADLQTGAARLQESQGSAPGAHTELTDLYQDNIQRTEDQTGATRQVVAGESAGTQQTAAPPLSRGVLSEPLEDVGTSAVEEFAGIVNRNFTTHGCPKCGEGFVLPTYLESHARSCTGRAV